MVTTAAPATFTYSGTDGTRIAAYRWPAPAAVRGVVQLTHGMGEHIRRYGHLAAALNAAGFEVVGQDHRGHGATAPDEAGLGRLGETGWAGLLDDIDVLVSRSRSEHPGVPLVLLGHSMGSFAVQQYLLDHSDRVDAAVLTGTAVIDLLAPALDLDQPIDLSDFNTPFAPARTDFDWLSRDPAQVDAYVDDPRCGFGLDVEGGKAMFTGAAALADPARLAALRPDLPVYVAVGEADPVNGQMVLVRALVERLRGAGLKDVTLVSYPEARHEIFNETNRDEVESDLIAWLDRVVPGRG
jgi:alpha-beta hydrolase superfamily lysophospholipase